MANQNIGQLTLQTGSLVDPVLDRFVLWRDSAIGADRTRAMLPTEVPAAIGLVIGTNVQAWDAELDAIAGLTSAANKLPYFTGLGTAATTDLTAAGRAILDDADATAQRATLGLTIGTNVQAYSANLTAYAGIAPSANVQSILSAADYAAIRTLLSLVVGTNVQAFNVNLSALAGLTSAADTLGYFTGSGTAGTTTLTTFGRSLIDDANAAAALATIGAAASGAVTTSGLTQSTAKILGRTTASTGAIEEIAAGTGLTLSAGSISAKLAKWTIVQDTTAASGTTQIPSDDTKPQNTEGTQYGTQSYTPAVSGSTLLVRVSGYCTASAATAVSLALFIDSGADSVATTITSGSASGEVNSFAVIFKYTTIGTSAQTWALRYGPSSAATAYVNRSTGGTLFDTTDFVTWEFYELV